MKKTLRYGILLAVFVAVSGLAVGIAVLQGRSLFPQVLAEEQGVLKDVFPEAEYFEPQKSQNQLLYYKALGKQKELVGAVFKASGKGYISTITTMVGMRKDGTITAIKVISQGETANVGSRVTEPEFAGEFANRKIRDIENVQAISGATLSSKAVIVAVRENAAQIKELIKDLN
jgi:electron transport complex protein RnfG